MEKKQFKGTQGKWNIVECSFGEKQIHIQQQNGCRSLAIIPFYNESDEANAKLIASAPELLEALQRITNMSNESGRKGCTYGDTDYDSESVVFGYNLCLEYITEDIQKIINKALGI